MSFGKLLETAVYTLSEEYEWNESAIPSEIAQALNDRKIEWSLQNSSASSKKIVIRCEVEESERLTTVQELAKQLESVGDITFAKDQKGFTIKNIQQTSLTEAPKVQTGPDVQIIVKPLTKSKEDADGNVVKSGAADAITTAYQERGSAFVIGKALVDNVHFENVEQFLSDDHGETIKKLYELYPTLETNERLRDEWIGIYIEQARVLHERFGSGFTDVIRDGDIMDYIAKVAKRFGFSKSDLYNPSDIWIIKAKSQNDLISKIKENINLYEDVQAVNMFLRSIYHTEELIGVSLKKLSGKTAKLEEVNVENPLELPLDDSNSFNFKQVTINLGLKGNLVATQDTKLVITTRDSTVNFQIKGNGTSSVANLKYEATIKGAGAARAGKAGVKYIAQELERIGGATQFKNEWQLYPQNMEKWLAKKDSFVEMFNNIVAHPNVITFIKHEDEFVHTIETVLQSARPWDATSKLMQLHFVNELMRLPSDTNTGNHFSGRDEFVTNMALLAMKMSKFNGPFCKVY